jgi:hypothetical protein
MQLEKMNPMAMKLQLHVENLKKALEENDSSSSRIHLSEIMKYADFMHSDLTTEIRKSENVEDYEGVNQFAGGVPVRKFNESGSNFDPRQRDSVLPGTIIPARTNTNMRTVSGTFGRKVE